MTTPSSIFKKKIKTTIFYNNLTFDDKIVNSNPNVEVQKISMGRKKKKLHGRQFILERANSEKIEFIFEQWEGDESILQNAFVKKYNQLTESLFNIIIKPDN